MVPGATSAIEKGPWHYGADYASVYFQGDPEAMGSLLPPHFKVAGGEGVAYVCDIVSVSDGEPGMVARQPDRTVYQEAALGVRCSLAGKAGVFYPVMWVSTEWALLRGLLNGYQKRLADKIALTRIHPLNPRLTPLGPGSELGGFCVKGGARTLSVSLRLSRQGSSSDLPSFGATFGLRAFPATDPSQEEVFEPVEIMKSNSRVSNVWLGGGEFESSLELGETAVTSAAAYMAGFTISGSRALDPGERLTRQE